VSLICVGILIEAWRKHYQPHSSCGNLTLGQYVENNEMECPQKCQYALRI